MNSNAIFGRIEVLFYSSLISCMSGVHHIRAKLENLTNKPSLVPTQNDQGTISITDEPLQKSFSINWNYISQSVISMAIWMVLGFAAGLLMGMLNPG